ncbi:unnamed protein product [Chilo suppressalis]|uniref:C2H2-type domain-containing protein n=1 Tax=Chilo suppressalis TaxID=168631 RepID=A0ABN8BGW7_CHISP|nr:unnamed protein product [Chilo suppressalis]
MKCAGDELLLGACWLDPKLDASPPAPCHDLLDSLLSPPPLAELKPLPPFTGYTRHLSINGISGHHFHAIAQRLPEENNNYPTQSGYGADHDVVSSSTCAADVEPPDLEDVKPFLDTDTKPFTDASAADSCAASCSPPAKLFDEGQKQGMYDDISSIEDIAAIIGSAIADTTVPSQPEDPDRNDSRDSWMDIDAWIAGACNQHGDKIVPHEMNEFVLPTSPPPQSQQNHHLEFSCKQSQDFAKSQEFIQKNLGQAGSTLQTLLTHGYMPLLQNRLQNGPPVKQEAPSSTSYGMDVISTSSPPGNAVSTTDGVSGILNGRYASHYALGLKPDGLCSPERLLGYPHAHTTTATPASKSKRSRVKAKQGSGNMHGGSLNFPSATAAELSGLLGKEKPVHRCGICNRGFLNKSNIKVHLRTHTGEKPFRCDVCAKAFRQKAHLIKHQQIHKRIGRD